MNTRHNRVITTNREEPGWDFDAYPKRSETDRLLVRFGEATGVESGHEVYRRDHVWPCAPTINQITVTGIIYLELSKVVQHLADPDPGKWRWWLGAERIRNSHPAPVTQAVNDRLVDILVVLAEDYLYRDDAAQLWQAHERHHASARLLCHRENLGLVEKELREWQRRAQHERSLLDRCWTSWAMTSTIRSREPSSAWEKPLLEPVCRPPSSATTAAPPPQQGRGFC